MTDNKARWGADKNVQHFQGVSDGLRREGQHGRAEVVEYLIERVIAAEAQLQQLEASKATANKGSSVHEVLLTANGYATTDFKFASEEGRQPDKIIGWNFVATQDSPALLAYVQAEDVASAIQQVQALSATLTEEGRWPEDHHG